MAMPTCTVKSSRPRPLQDLGRASAASHNMKLRLAFPLAYHHIWLTVAYVVLYSRRLYLEPRILYSIRHVKNPFDFPQFLRNSMAGGFSRNVCQPSYSASTLLPVYGTQKTIIAFINTHHLILS